MAGIKTYYAYREFKDCPLATFVDKYTTHPTATTVMGILLGTLVMMIGVPFYNASSGEGFLAVLGYVFIIAGFILFFIGGPLIRKLSGKMDWAGKIAAKKRSKSQK